MRLRLRGESPVERAALRAGMVPTPAVEAFGATAAAGVLIAAVRLGVTAALVRRARSASDLAADLGLDSGVTALMLDCLRSTGLLTARGGRYRVARSARRWLDPDSPVAVTNFVAACADYGPWWGRLPEVARSGVPIHHHDAPADSDYWPRYMLGQRDLARLSAGLVARRLPVPAGATALLDIGGGHGTYSRELCGRHPGLHATVLDLPGSARAAQAIADGNRHADRVRFVAGDALADDLGGPYDVVLCFNLVHHLREADIPRLFERVHDALRPGGIVCVLDGFAPRSGRTTATTAYLSLFMYLSSGSRMYPTEALHGWLDPARFTPPRRLPMRRLPGLALYTSHRR
jgi:SAM-dependent methyltransferase